MKQGTCDMCGKEGQDLRMMLFNDFAGWACEECRRQLAECQVRRYCSTGEETEPGE